MRFAKEESSANNLLESFGVSPRQTWELTPMKFGDRAFLITVEGEFPATIIRNWSPSIPLSFVLARLDCDKAGPIELHRGLFRAFNALDSIAAVG